MVTLFVLAYVYLVCRFVLFDTLECCLLGLLSLDFRFGAFCGWWFDERSGVCVGVGFWFWM